MSATRTARRRRTQARQDVRYAKSSGSKANRRAFLAAKAAKAGRSFGFSKK